MALRPASRPIPLSHRPAKRTRSSTLAQAMAATFGRVVVHHPAKAAAIHRHLARADYFVIVSRADRIDHPGMPATAGVESRHFSLDLALFLKCSPQFFRDCVSSPRGGALDRIRT